MGRITRALLPLAGLCLLISLTSCGQSGEIIPLPEEELATPGPRAVANLQRLATESCLCARERKERHYEPSTSFDFETGEKPRQPSSCWREFAEELQPFKFEYGAVAACGPGSDTTSLELGGKSIMLHYGFGTCSPEDAEKAMEAYEKEQGEGGC